MDGAKSSIRLFWKVSRKLDDDVIEETVIINSDQNWPFTDGWAHCYSPFKIISGKLGIQEKVDTAAVVNHFQQQDNHQSVDSWVCSGWALECPGCPTVLYSALCSAYQILHCTHSTMYSTVQVPNSAVQVIALHADCTLWVCWVVKCSHSAGPVNTLQYTMACQCVVALKHCVLSVSEYWMFACSKYCSAFLPQVPTSETLTMGLNLTALL